MEDRDALAVCLTVPEQGPPNPVISREPVSRRDDARRWASVNERPNSSRSLSAVFSRTGSILPSWERLFDSDDHEKIASSPMIPRKPVPRRYSVRRWPSINERPGSVRSFSAAFSRIGHILAGRIREDESTTDEIQQIYRFTSQFDPHMESGLSPFIPFPVRAEPTYRKLPRESNIVDALNINWRLPPLIYTSFGDTVDESSISLPGNTNVEAPLDGGTLAWLQVVGSFFLFFNSWGIANSFGVFQTYYETQSGWKESPSNISWIGSVQGCLTLLVSFVAGPLFDAGYLRQLICAGCFLVTLGYMMLSLSTEYWQVLLAQGICIGIGTGFLIVPALAILPQYFTARNALANGIASNGSSLGGIIIPFIFHNLQQDIGFGWTTRILGFISLTTSAISLYVMKPRLIPERRRKLFNFSAFKELPYLFFCPGVFASYMGYLVPAFYLGPLVKQTGIASEEFAFYLLPILHTASCFGRIAPNLMVHYLGSLNIFILMELAAGSIVFLWCGLTTFTSTIVFSILYGFFYGGCSTMMPVALVALTPDLEVLGNRLGQTYCWASLGTLTGPPISGTIFGKSSSWIAVKCFGGVVFMLATFLFTVARVSKIGGSLRHRI